MITVLGNSIHFIKKYIIDNYGKDFFKNIIEKTDEDVKEVLDFPILSQKKYDVKIKQQLCTVFMANVKTKEEFIKCSVAEVQEQLKGVIYFVIKHISFSFIVNNLQKIWNQHFSGGKISGEVKADGRVEVKIEEFESNQAFVLHIAAYVGALFDKATGKHYDFSIKEIDKSCFDIHYQVK